MALVTPRSGRIPHTPKMSERKRALFQSSSESCSPMESVRRRALGCESGDSDSCDLGILSPIESSDSSEPFDQSVPQTPHSWRGTSSLHKNQEKGKKKTARQILKSPLTFKNYMTRKSLVDKYTAEHSNVRMKLVNILADTESCSSSLQDLTFHSDSDLSDSKENTPSKKTHSKKSKPKTRTSKRLADTLESENTAPQSFKSSLKYMKTTDMSEFQLPEEYDLQISPSRILKTPHDNVMNAQTPPRIGHRRSVKECLSYSPSQGNCAKKRLGEASDEIDGNHKNSRLNSTIPGPRARLSLFSSGETKHFLSPKSFYPKSNVPSANLDTSFCSEISIKVTNSSQQSKRCNKPPSSRSSYKRNRKRRLGEINMGVRHGIRKPKQNKYTILTKDQKLKLALKIIDDSPLNNYINNYMTMKKSNITINNVQPSNAIILNVQNESDELAKATGLSQNQLNKMDTILKQLGCTKSLNNILCPEISVAPDSENTHLAGDDEDQMCEVENSSSKKKFFKSARNANQLKKAVFNKYLPSKKASKDKTTVQEKLTMLQNMVQMSELFGNEDEEDNLDMPEKNSIDALLTQWSDEEVPDNEPQIIKKNIEDNMSINYIPLPEAITNNMLISNAHVDDIFTSNNQNIECFNRNNYDSMVLNMNEGSNSESSRDITDSVPAFSSSCNTQILPVDGGYIIVNDDGMMDEEGPCNLEMIDSELKALDKQIMDMAKLNNINPALLLSPGTDQMCTMASGLALSSPKIPSYSEDIMAEDSLLIITDSEPYQSIDSSGQLECSNDLNDKKRKLYPVFVKDEVKAKQARLEENLKIKKSTKSKHHSGDMNQYQIDAGQANFGATQCNECGVIYQIGDAKDEADHMRHHLALDILKFNGWKNERVCGHVGGGRILVVQSGDPQSHWQRITDLLERVVHPQLGYAAPLAPHKSYKVYLYVESRQLMGCLVAEQVQTAYKLLQGGDCCSSEAYPVKAGISRIWTHTSHRKKGIASNLLNSMRANFYFGHILSNQEIAFSSPTVAGKTFAEKYTKNPNFFVYID